MKIDAIDYLRLVENAGTLLFVDSESTGLKGDYNSLLVFSVKPYGGKPESIVVSQLGHDQKVARVAKEVLEKADCWVTYYGKGFDIPLLNTRLLKWGLPPVEKRPHVDLYFTLKYRLLTGRKSQAHLLRWLGTAQQKMDIGADVWALASEEKNLKLLKERCESDTEGLEALYNRTKHLIVDITR